MKKIYTISCALFCLLLSKSGQAQLSDVTYSVRTVNITSYENASFGACFEAGNEEYTGYVFASDNVNASEGGTGCQTCDNNGDCSYAGGISLNTRTNNSYSIISRIDAWEDDQGSRCSYDGSCFICNSDDCHNTTSGQSYNFREFSFPSSSSYSNGPTWGSTSDHQWTLANTWKYNGTTSSITPTCNAQTASFGSGQIKSWSVFLTAGVTYRFSTCASGSTDDTYLRLFGTDGFTIEALSDDACGLLSQIDFTASSTGWYYLELSRFTRNALTSTGNLSYQILPKTGANISIPINAGTLSCAAYSNTQNNTVNTGFCDDFGQASDDIYYAFTLSNAATINLSLCSSGFDTYLWLLNSGGTTLASNDDNGPLCAGLPSSIQQSLSAGSYYAVSEGFGSNSGDINTLIQVQVPTGGSISGPTSICASSTGIVYSISGVNFATSYNWTVPAGASITSGAGTTSITVSFGGTTGSATVSCTPTTYGGACVGSAVNYSITINAQPIAPTLNVKTPATSSVCSGTTVSATFNAGSGGTGCSDDYIVSIDGGAATAYTPGSSVGGSATSTIVIQGRRASCTAGSGCTGTAYVTLASWTVNSSSTAPSSITGVSTICSPSSTTLSVSGGSLGTGANWQWYSDSCGGTSVGSGPSITIAPGSTTTYFVRAEGACNTTICASIVVTVSTSSTAPVSITGVSTICAPSSTTLSVSGGSLGTGANWQWYSGSCGGTSVGSGPSITVTPSSTTTYFVRAEGTCNTTLCASQVVTVNSTSTAPSSITGVSTICSPSSTTLSVSGGSLGTGANWQWYSGSCGGTSVGSGPSITIAPGSTTTYFVRAEGACNTTICASIVVTVNTSSTAPVSITGVSTICAPSSTTLTVSGGSLGTGADWQWYSGSCGGIAEGSGPSITVTPGSTTTYFVRAEGTCNTTSCATQLVTVNIPSTAPVSISGISTICNGDNTTLTVSGGTLGTGGIYTWYSGSCGGTLVGTGVSVIVSPTSSTTYFVRIEGTCNTTTCISQLVTVNTLSTAPVSVTGVSTICAPSSTTLTVSGGSLGTGADWQWYSGSCGGIAEGSGPSITVTPGSTTTYFVRAEGTCNTTSCASQAVTVNVASTDPTSISGTSVICPGASTTLTVVGGSLGTGASWQWYSGSCGGVSIGTGNSISVSTLTPETYFVRAEGTCGNSNCASLTINVHPLPNGNISGSTSICASASTFVYFHFSSGTGPFDITYTDGSTLFSLIGVNDGDSTLVSPPIGVTTYSYTSVSDANGCSRIAGFLGSSVITISNPPSIASVGHTDVSCFGGSNGTITVSASATLTPMSYSIDSGSTYVLGNVFTGLMIGNYNISVRDNLGCLSFYSLNPEIISEPSMLDLAISTITPASCGGIYDGSIAVTGSGGTTPYQYSINGGAYQPSTIFSGLSAGTYLILVADANNCTDTISASILNSYVLQDSLVSKSNVSCAGDANGSFLVNAYGGVAPYQYSIDGILYQLSGLFTSLAPGSYNVLSRDSRGCQNILNVVISAPNLFAVNIDSSINGRCFGDSIAAIYTSSSGGTIPYSYVWSSGAITDDIIGLSVGTYHLTVTDGNGCLVTISRTLSSPSPLFLNVAGSQNARCNGSSDAFIDITVNGGTPGYSYLWSNGSIIEDEINVVAGTYTVTVSDMNGCNASITTLLTEPSALSLSATVLNVSCNRGIDGSIDITPSGGTFPYTFLWSNGTTSEDLTGLRAGTYTVIIRDANACSTSGTYTVTEPNRLDINVVSSNVSCYGFANGTINVTASGGSGSFTYTWSDGGSGSLRGGLSAGSYNVTVQDLNGCMDSANIIITQPDSLNVNSILTPVSCAGGATGSIDLTVSGGTSPYAYNWGAGILTQDRIGLGVGTYTVVITDANACSSLQSYVIAEPLALNSSTLVANPTCYGDNDGSIDLSVSGGTSPYSFLWSNLQITEDNGGLTAGTYFVIITDLNGCSKRDSGIVVQPARLSLTFANTDVLCSGDTSGLINLTVNGGTIPYSFIWNDLTILEDRTGLGAGTYSVYVTDFNGCTDSGSTMINAPAPLLVSAVSTDVRCSGGSSGSINLSVMGGLSPYSYLWNDGSITQDRTGLSAATYSVTVTDVNGCSNAQTFVINEPSVLSSTTTSVNPTCYAGNNGSIDLTVTGGSSPYSFLWSNLQITEDNSGLMAGTYFVIITDNNGCLRRDSSVVTQPARITFLFSNSNALCSSSATAAIDLTVSGGTTPYSFLWNDLVITEDRTSILPGTYSVVVTDFNSCKDSSSTVVGAPIPLLTSAVLSNVRCFGDTTGSINLTVSGGTAPYTYDWGGITTEDRPYVGAGSYAVTVTDANACQVIASFSISQPSILTASINTHDVTCYGGNDGSARAIASGGTTPYNYFWSSFILGDTISGRTIGTYSVLISDFNGCQTIRTASINSPSVIDPHFDITNARCYGSVDGYILTNTTGGVGPYLYNWSTGDTTSFLNPLSAGSYVLTSTDSRGCTHIDTAVVDQPDSLIIRYVVTDVNCYGESNGAIDITVTGGNPAYGYSWVTPMGTSILEDITSGVAGSYVIAVADLLNCGTTAFIEIHQPDSLAISAIINQVTCAAAANGIIDIDVNGGVPPYRFNWSTGSTTEDELALSGGTYTVTVTDAHNCTLIRSYIITEPAPINIVLTTMNPTCFGDLSGMVMTAVSGGTTPYHYLWSTFDTSSIIDGRAAGIYSVSVTDANGCSVYASATITQPSPILITGITTDLSCYGNNTGAIDITVSSSVGVSSYLWSNASPLEDITAIAAGTYTVIVRDSNSCVATTAFVVNQPDSMFSNISGVLPSCAAGNSGFAEIDVFGGTPAYAYAWSTTPTQTTNIASGLSAGIYTVTVTDAHGCILTNSVDITVSNALSMTLTANNAACNSSANGKITAHVTGGSAPYIYQLGTIIQADSVFANLVEGTYTIVVIDANGCNIVDVATVVATEVLQTHIEASDRVIARGDAVTLNLIVDSTSSDVSSIDWNPESTIVYTGCLVASNCNTVNAFIADSTTFMTYTTTLSGCIDTAAFTVYVRTGTQVFVPTVFTPNGDGKNETFDFQILGAQHVNVTIYNRYGELIYSNIQHNGVGEGWDGTFQGAAVGLDSYTYQFVVEFFDGHKETMGGSVTVMR